MFRNFKVLFALLAVLVIAGGAYAFATTNTFTTPPTKIGDSAATISGYTISAIEYTYAASPNSGNIDEVAFTTSAKATSVKIQLVADGGFYDCLPVVAETGIAWTCDTTDPQATASTTDQLRVLASDFVLP